jgi:hypothetical protein
MKGHTVARYYGVKCKLCETPIAFGRVTSEGQNQIAFYVPPLDPIGCRECGASYVYRSDDMLEFETEGNIELFPK